MIENRHATVRVLGLVAFGLVATAPALTGQQTVLEYLPNEVDLVGWDTLGEPQTAEGDDLFLLINGGAEIYHEYGFSRAVIQSYDRGDVSINVEIYEMADAESAYGVYSFKTGRGGELIDLGGEATLEDYYLNLWKGNVVATLIGFDTESETRSRILELARLIEANISGDSRRPDIVDLLPDVSDGGERKHVTFLQGYLGLINRYRFGNEDVFGVRHGVLGDYGEFRVFLFDYETTEAAGDRFVTAQAFFGQSERYTRFTTQDQSFSALDLDNRHIFCNLDQEYLIVYVGETPDEAATVVSSIRRRISEYSGPV